MAGKVYRRGNVMFASQNDIIELHDDVIVAKRVMLERREGQPPLLHVSFELRPDRDYQANANGEVGIVTTNGITFAHVRVPLEHVTHEETPKKKAK